tara:strand:+ start:1524 stop:2108 length:585 start_codon:yes stop_codon:yes gene_type:complete
MNISKNFLNKKELNIVNNEILKQDFPWYTNDAFANNSALTTKFPLLSHTLIKRCDDGQEPVPNSDYYSLFKEIVKRFCKKHKIKFNKFTRASLNLTFCNTKHPFISPHSDHFFKHNLLIIYLNNSSGNTLIFDRKYKKGNSCIDISAPESKKLKVIKKIKPEQGKVFVCDGSYFHSYEFCKHDETRIVGVFTFV